MSVPQEYFEAGRIASEVRNNIRKTVRPGMSILEICNTVENAVRSRGGKPAFPCNVSRNSVAAHYTADIADQSVLHDGDVVKIDMGVHISGYLVDTAVTVCFNSAYDDLTQATETALTEGIKLVKEGARAGEIGRVIESVAERWGFRPISNLCGHSIEPYRVHAGLSIPNAWMPGTRDLKAGSVYAIEPFLTSRESFGEVDEGKARNIYSLLARKSSGDKAADLFAEKIWNEYRTLPFAPRYWSNEYSKAELQIILNKLLAKKIVRVYPELVEPAGKIVAQFEHSIALTEEGPFVLT
ncbi:MAG: type II methionyl aminopeptidase [Thaumarchaeota archaeon]|nr:type II methionyl aminopeptidase [Nitrososphaerota archaeon]